MPMRDVPQLTPPGPVWDHELDADRAMGLIRLIRLRSNKSGGPRRRYVGRISARSYATASRDPYVRAMVERVASERTIRRAHEH